MSNKVVFCAYRENKGPVGGAGGVLFMLQEIVGNSIPNINCEYIFMEPGENHHHYVNRLIKTDADFYICHDVISGFLLSLYHKRYCLIYHQQGPLTEERLNLGLKISPIKAIKTKIYERRSFKKAISVHFPSNGAMNMYFNSKYRSVNKDQVCVGETMYNTIYIEKTSEEISGVLQNVMDVSDCLTLYSVGTLTEAKGQDRTILFINKLCAETQGRIRYILIGQGVLKDKLIDELEKIHIAHSNFSYTYIPRLKHSDILKVGELADAYIMLHRISIFDLATLEAMQTRNAIILSNIGGNLDFNKLDNVCYCDCVNYSESVINFLDRDLEEMKKLNQMCFDQFFSEKAFYSRYQRLALELFE